MTVSNIPGERELEFAIFCIENIALHLQVPAERVYDALTVKSDALYQYIVPCYEMLHTQGKAYIVNDILAYLQEKGVEI